MASDRDGVHQAAFGQIRHQRAPFSSGFVQHKGGDFTRASSSCAHTHATLSLESTYGDKAFL